jgi:hypothetical protein
MNEDRVWDLIGKLIALLTAVITLETAMLNREKPSKKRPPRKRRPKRKQ